MVKAINRIAVFVIELIMTATFAHVGFQKGNNMLSKYSCAFILPLVVILLWSYFAAPKSSHRLKMPYLAIFRLALFLTAAYLLYKSGQINFAIVLAFSSVITQMISCFIGD